MFLEGIKAEGYFKTNLNNKKLETGDTDNICSK